MKIPAISLDFNINYVLTVLLIGALLFYLVRLGLFRFIKRILKDCLTDHTTGRITINNLGRFSLLVAFLTVFFTMHYDLILEPEFFIKTKPLSEALATLILIAIGLYEGIKKYKATDNIIQKNYVENSEITNNLPPKENSNEQQQH